MLHFEIKPTTMKVGKNKGSTLYYAKQRTHDRIRTSDLERRIERMTTLSRADIHAALIALSDVINEELATYATVSEKKDFPSRAGYLQAHGLRQAYDQG